MIWIRITVICTLVCLLHAHKECMGHVKWELFTLSLNSMGSAISLDCAYDYDDDSLCNPRHLVNMVNHNAVLLVDVINRAETLYRENPNPKMFIEALQHTRYTIRPCIHHSHEVAKEPVTTCFNKLESFLKKKSHSQCGWEIVNSKVKEIFQRLEKRSVVARRR
ncbi:uncharacterized protein ifnu [Misgurnus anguillicaudatus]|uniref:uncharacterized protein ifnu n=1 Tax=Misgurnus anguillicaudatus TaxID=75329 RepID=UPI003CCEF9F3